MNQSTARFLNESSFAFTLYNGDPDQKFTMTSYPFDWLEASAFYTKIQGKPEPGLDQDYIDKGFNFKIRLKEEGILPAVALGINDAAGTGFYSSEYIVASYGIKNLDLHFGLGWGTLNGKDDFKNPLRYIDSRFGDRPTVTQGRGGQFQPSRYFSGETSTPFFGASYFLNEKTSIKLERDTTVTPGKVGFELPKSDISLGLDFMPNENFVVGLAFERGNAVSLRFAFKRDPKKSPNITYQKSKIKDENKYNNLIKNLEDNGIGVNKIVDKGNKLGIEVTQFSLPNLDFVEEVLMSAKSFSNIEKDIIANYKIAGLSVEDNIDLSDGDVVFDRARPRGFNTSNKIVIRPFLAARESFLKAAILLEPFSNAYRSTFSVWACGSTPKIHMPLFLKFILFVRAKILILFFVTSLCIAAKDLEKRGPMITLTPSLINSDKTFFALSGFASVSLIWISSLFSCV